VPLILQRIDERLIHGQVVLGWGNQLRPTRYLVVDDVLAGSEWEQELYRLGAGDADVVFADTETARSSVASWHGEPDRSVLLTRDVETMEALVDVLPPESEVNLGGLHHGPERREYLTYLHLSEKDVAALRAMDQAGALVYAQDLPDAARVSLASLLRG
jgi:PTS system mannose-specific IIB component/fructoselysine and glucoselysine-specific PTS system IIB component